MDASHEGKGCVVVGEGGGREGLAPEAVGVTEVSSDRDTSLIEVVANIVVFDFNRAGGTAIDKKHQ